MDSNIGGTVLALQTSLTATATATQNAAKAQTALAKATQAAAKAAKNALAGFDELHTVSAAAGKGSGKVTGIIAETAVAEASALQKLADTALAALTQIGTTLQGLFAPSIGAWMSAAQQVGAALQQAFATVQGAAQGLWQNALAPLATYLLTEFVPQISGAFSLAFAPITGDVLATALTGLSGLFATICTLITDAVNTLLLPALALLQTAFSDMMLAVTTTWESYGAPLMEQLAALFTSVGTLATQLYETILVPILAGLTQGLQALWEGVLAPLWQNLTQLFAETALCVLQLWNDVLSPFLQFFMEHFGPVIAATLQGVGNVFFQAATLIGGLVNTITDVLRGLLTFLSGIFSGEWSKAWGGIESAFGSAWNGITSLLKNAINLVIDCVNLLLQGVTSGINAVVGALNGIQVTIPSWVPGFGGRSFGISLPTVSSLQIPKLAKGAVIPPNSEFLAILGDQKSGRNLEAPESLLRQIVREESGAGAMQLEAQQPVELILDGKVLYRTMLKIRAQRGVELGGVFADAL